MKKVIVFGAAGGTGRLVVEQLLQARHQVTAVVRSPDGLTLRHHQLRIIVGDVFQPGTFENEIWRQDVVVSCLGIRKREPTTVYSEGVGNIIKAMQQANITRIICLSAGAVGVPTTGSFLVKFFIKNILQRIFKHSYADMRIMEKIVKETNLNWTVIRPPWLRNSGHTGKYRTNVNGHLSSPSKLSRADLADYIVNHLTDETTFQVLVEISY